MAEVTPGTLNMHIIFTWPSSSQITVISSISTLSFYRLDTLPAAQPTVSEHWRQISTSATQEI